MRHQEFEDLLFERESLQQEELNRLEAHLQECDRCLQLSEHLANVDDLLRFAPSVPAPDGFTDRFKIRLEKARQQRKARLLLFTTSLTVIGVLAGVGLLGYVFISSGATIFSWLLKAINQLYWVGATVEVVVETVFLLLEGILEQLPLVTLMAISGALSLLALTWITSLYRFNYSAIRRES
jgi:predicted anti-sigma-YlaC factor YlaD